MLPITINALYAIKSQKIEWDIGCILVNYKLLLPVWSYIQVVSLYP